MELGTGACAQLVFLLHVPALLHLFHDHRPLPKPHAVRPPECTSEPSSPTMCQHLPCCAQRSPAIPSADAGWQTGRLGVGEPALAVGADPLSADRPPTEHFSASSVAPLIWQPLGQHLVVWHAAAILQFRVRPVPLPPILREHQLQIWGQ